MPPLDYARRHIEAFLREVNQLRESEFPFGQSRAALDRIAESFEERKKRLSTLSSTSSPEVINQACSEALSQISIFLPLLGFILNSTNVRNAFEIHGPLLRLARDVLVPIGNLEPDRVSIILSSEWEYSPFTYAGFYDKEELEGFVLIGLPATESSNALLIPLAGHELGHIIWKELDLEGSLKDEIEERIRHAIVERWDQYKKTVNLEWSQEELLSHWRARETWVFTWRWAIRQIEETFCDFIALQLFDASYLQAFAYLLAPNTSFVRSPLYPHLPKRAKNLVRAAGKCGVQLENLPGYEMLFTQSSDPSLTQADRFQLETADIVVDNGVVDLLIQRAEDVIRESSVDRAADERVTEIHTCYKHGVPASGLAEPPSLPNILNAAWKAHDDDNLWKDNPEVSKNKDEVLNELVLKNIEILEIELRMRNGRDTEK